jgi:hypothetical protein
VRTEVAQGDPAHLQLAVVGARTARDLAPVTDAGLGRVARQFRQLQSGFKTFFERQAFVDRDSLQRVALGGILLDESLDPKIAINGAFLCHLFFPSRP